MKAQRTENNKKHNSENTAVSAKRIRRGTIDFECICRDGENHFLCRELQLITRMEVFFVRFWRVWEEDCGMWLGGRKIEVGLMAEDHVGGLKKN
jgi:hypothetical protein